MYKQTLYDLIDLLEEKHLDCYFNISKESLNEYVKQLLSTSELNDEYDFYYLSNKIIKKIFGPYDSHTKVVYKNADCNLPIRLKFIDNKIYIIKTDEKHKDLLFSQILKINDIDINVLIKELAEMVAYSTKGFLESEIEKVFYNGKKIKALPSISKNIDVFKYTILKDEKIKEVELEYSNQKFIDDKNYTYELFDNAMVIHYTACSEEYEGQMNDFVKEINIMSKENNIENYIVDIRKNMGGNAYIINSLIEYLKNKKIIVLTDKYIFSGGRHALIDLINIGAKTVGTGIGTPLNCFGNISRNEIDEFIIPISYKYYYFDGNILFNTDSKEQLDKMKNSENSDKIFKPIIFEPDYYVENSIEDIKNGYDRQLQKALELINEKEIKHKK